jgi:hypothetical protein
VISRSDLHHDIVVSDDSTNWGDTAGNRLGKHENIRLSTIMLVPHELSCSPKASLDFVGNAEDIVFLAESLHLGQVSLVRNDNTTFSLNWLEVYSNTVIVGLEHFFEVLDVIVVDKREARSEWTKLVISRRVITSSRGSD